MGGELFNVNGKSGGSAAEALRADAQRVDTFQQFFFQFCIERIFVSFIKRTEQK